MMIKIFSLSLARSLSLSLRSDNDVMMIKIFSLPLSHALSLSLSVSFSLIDVIMIMKMRALGGECEPARGDRNIRGEGGGGAARNCFVLFACRLGAGTTLHAAAPPCKVVFAKPHRDSCSWGALRACSWGAALDGHVRGEASRRSRQSCAPSTAASLTSCRAVSTAPSTGTEAHERRATRQRAQRGPGFPPARGLTSQGTRPATPFIGDLGGGLFGEVLVP